MKNSYTLYKEFMSHFDFVASVGSLDAIEACILSKIPDKERQEIQDVTSRKGLYKLNISYFKGKEKHTYLIARNVG